MASMDEDLIKRVVIVGGGTAGWLSATMMSSVLGKSIEIVLVESEEIGIVGVGEATIPPLVTLFSELGLNEAELMAAVQGTYKLGIEFVDWSAKGSTYSHAFGKMGHDIGLAPFYQAWLSEALAGDIGSHAGSLWDFSLNHLASKGARFAHLDRIKDTPLTGLTYALHFDAGLLAGYLRKRCEARGVVRREGRVVDVALRSQDGFIESLTLASGETVAGDLFIDCSGFRGLLIKDALEAGYEDWSSFLPCDRAIAVPCASAGPLLPYTRATARDAGWQWRIPLQHRIGNGHVFCSAFTSEDDATRTLMANLDGEPLADPRPLRFTTGRRRSSWVKNCLALGLAAGFMEPLESTSIHLVQSGMTRFLKVFPDKRFHPATTAAYNRETEHEYQLIRDFLVLHYKATQRDDTPFWRHCRAMAIPDSLAGKIEYFREYGHLLIEQADLFKEENWVQVLIGQGILPRVASPLSRSIDRRSLAAYMADLRNTYARTAAALPSHEAYLARMMQAVAAA
jgi:tryptophan halogenase